MGQSDSLGLAPFDYQPRTRVCFGVGALDRLGELTRELGGRRVLLVSDPGVVAAGHAERGRAVLVEAGLDAILFDGVEVNPTTEHVDAGLAVAKAERIDFLVGLGGGSVMDCAKGINFLLTNGGRMQDYWGVGKASKPMLPMIAVPTTAGTGSEAQSFALILDPETRTKMACGDKKAACRAAILDPALTVSQPREVTVATGIDAASHAIESYVTRRRNRYSQMLSREAWALINTSFERVLAEPGDLEARAAALLGAHYAGAAIEQSMLGAAHACANPLTTRYGITHGIAVGVMLPHVIRLNASATGIWYSELVSGRPGDADPQADDAEWLASRVATLLRVGGVAGRLSDHGVQEADVPALAEDAARQWTGQFNPQPVDARVLGELYRQAL